MADIEKVIRDLPVSIRFAESRGYSGLAGIMRDALTLLEAREPKPPRFVVAFDKVFYACDNCGKSLLVVLNAEGVKSVGDMPKYCPKCGQEVKRE